MHIDIIRKKKRIDLNYNDPGHSIRSSEPTRTYRFSPGFRQNPIGLCQVPIKKLPESRLRIESWILSVGIRWDSNTRIRPKPTAGPMKNQHSEIQQILPESVRSRRIPKPVFPIAIRYSIIIGSYRNQSNPIKSYKKR